MVFHVFIFLIVISGVHLYYHDVNFSMPTSGQSATFVRPLFAFYCTLSFTKNNNKLYGISLPTHRCLRCATDGSAKSINCAARTMTPPLCSRLIARSRHGRWCHRYGKGFCFNSTGGHTGYILVMPKCFI